MPRYYGATSNIISIKHVLEARDMLVPFLVCLNKNGMAWYIVGGAVPTAHDQMTAIPQSRREGGIQLTLADLTINPDIMETMFPIIFGDLDPSADAFPGFVGHNHMVRHGPLKEDWTKPCPLSYTLDEMDELCISEQEATWGTELLARLEKFKATINPDGIMTCPTGVGFKRATGAESVIVSESNTTDVESSGGGETETGVIVTKTNTTDVETSWGGGDTVPENEDGPASGGSSYVLSSIIVLGVVIAVWL
jgi:hypothetical protein